MISKCSACHDGVAQPLPFSMAFQPIVDTEAECVYAYEALVRGTRGEGAATVLTEINESNRYAFDQSCRVHAITLASQLRLQDTPAKLSINFLPGAVYSPAACIKLTLATARQVSFPLDRLMFEITEGEEVHDPKHLQAIADEYRHHGFQVAIDDFGAGYAGMNLLADLPIDVLKIDMALTRNVHLRPRAARLMQSLAEACHDLGIVVVAEGIETEAEFREVERCKVRYMQGYLLAKPAFEALPSFTLPSRSTAAKPRLAPSKPLPAKLHLLPACQSSPPPSPPDKPNRGPHPFSLTERVG